jgi:endogenous inhibitor of DNA gyrase (YacG/DUF329 family)
MPEARCPICRRPAGLLHLPGEPRRRGPFPFCSERCRQVDLGRWLTESYAVPAAEPEDAPEEER